MRHLHQVPRDRGDRASPRVASDDREEPVRFCLPRHPRIGGWPGPPSSEALRDVPNVLGGPGARQPPRRRLLCLVSGLPRSGPGSWPPGAEARRDERRHKPPALARRGPLVRGAHRWRDAGRTRPPSRSRSPTWACLTPSDRRLPLLQDPSRTEGEPQNRPLAVPASSSAGAASQPLASPPTSAAAAPRWAVCRLILPSDAPQGADPAG
jgi:hypothetical protein